MDFTQILLNTQNPDARIRTEAENFLAQSKAQNLGMYLTTLTAELVDENKNLQTRMVAGIILKNELNSQNESKRLEKESSWLNLDHGIRDNIKNGVLHTLGSPIAFSRAAAVCACIAQIELPKNLWPQLIDILLQNTNSNNESLKKGTLQALGYICEELNPAVVADKSNGILTAIVQSMREEEKNVEVKHAAAKALENALEFAKENFTRPVERDYIMSMVCGAVCSPHVDVKVAGYECLVKIANLYYEYLPPYMQSLFNLTLESIKKDDQSAALQAIEFWSTICDEEIYLMDEIEEANSLRVQPSVVCHNFVKGALQFLVPLILETLTKQDEDADEDQWDIAMAGATCLTLISNCVRNEILQTVVPFVTQNLNNAENWHLREAASMAFGSILEGVSDISPLIVQAIPILIQHMQSDSQPLVKDTAAWTIGRICQLHPSAIRGDVLNAIMAPLLNSLSDTPRVAANVCWALNNIAESFRDEESKPADNFRPYFESSVAGLLQAAERSDADENNLKASAYEAINEFMQSAESECLIVIQALVPIFVARLEATFKVQILSQEDRDNVAETQGLLCSLLQTCTQKLDKQIAPFADACAALYLRVFTTKSTTVQEEALMAFGALANALEADFEKYMAHFLPFLLLGLNSHEAYQVCTISVGVVGDVCRALQKRVAQYCQDIITILINHLKDTHLNKSVKPPILSCFGDMALAICGEFTKYLNMVMLILLQAASYEVDKTNDELVDFQNELREGIFEAFTGILQGLRTDDQAEQFLPYVDNVVAFITTVIFKDQTRTDSVTRGAIGVLGDLAHALGSKVKPQLQQDSVRTLISQCLRSDSDTTVEVATWAQEVIAKL